MTQTRHLVQSPLLLAATVCLLLFVSSDAFSTTLPMRQDALITRQQKAPAITFADTVALSAKFNDDGNDDNEDDREREYARVRRRRGGRAYYDDDDVDDGYGRSYEDDDQQRSASNVGDYYDDEEDDDEDYYYDDDDDEEEVDDEYSMFGSAVIPNPLLDSIDPDGAAERFPELARDPKFWIDMLVFIAVLDFLSDIGPRNALPDIPYY